jgi:predicted GIY-YIG superfamily endonuclease
MDKTVYIYVLRDPRNNTVRYVGKTKHPKQRANGHKYAGFPSWRGGLWQREMKKDGVKPILQVIEECSEADGAAREKYWIKKLSETCPLLNVRGLIWKY